MHSPDRVAGALELHAAGHNASEISRLTGISRGTIRDWVAGKVPKHRLRTAGVAACRECGLNKHRFDELPDAYVYLLGVYLGDGCISTHPRRVFRLRVVLDLRHPGIVNEVAGAIQTLVPHNKLSRLERTSGYTDRPEPTYVELGAYSKGWPCLFPQHGPGKKHERLIRLTDWQLRLVERSPEFLLRGLTHSDGCRFINTGRGGWRCPRYVFNNTSDDILGIFRLACEFVGVHYTTAPKTVYVSRKADVALLDRFIGPKA
jgi:hypothetical protein